MSAPIRRSWIPPTVMESEAAAEGAVAKVLHVRYALPRSYAWVRTAEGKARRVSVLWDTGATHTIINPKIVADLNLVVKKEQGLRHYLWQMIIHRNAAV